MADKTVQGEYGVTDAKKAEESKQTLDADQDGRALYRANQQQRLLISLLVFTVIAWVIGKYDASIAWILAVLAWIVLWWNNNATRVIDLAAKEAEIDRRRQRALSNAETVEWLNFLINRWFVFSDRSLHSLIKNSLDPILESQKPSYVGSIEVLDFTLGNRTPYLKHVTIYDHPDDQRYIRASELNFNHPPDDLITRGKYQVVIHLDVGLTSPEARFIIRMRLGNKGFLGTCTDVAVEDFQISGKLQLVLLFNQNVPFPHLASVSICFTEEPDVSFNIRLLKAVQLMEFPLLRQWITQIVNEYLKFALVDPGHVTIPFCDDPDVVGRGAAYACGVLTLTINGGSHGKLTDDPYWCSVKIAGQKRFTREVIGDTAWTENISLLVYHLYADKLVIKLKGRRKLGTKYTIAEHVLQLSTLCLESNHHQDHALEKSFRPATLTLQMEYTPLPVIDVNHSIPHEEFSRNYASRLRNLYPNEVSGVLLVCAHSGHNLVPMDKHGLSNPYCVIYENSRQAKRGETVKGTLSPIWDTMVEILVADYTQTTLSFVVLDKDTNAIKMIKEDRDDFMGSCNLSLTQVSPVLFKKNLDLIYKVKGTGMMKAGKLCVSAIFRPVPSVVKSETRENGQGLPEGECPGLRDVKTEAQTLEALLRAERGSIEVNIYQGRDLVAKDVNGKSDPFVTVKQGSEGREKFRTRTIDNTLQPVWNESTVVAMPETNGLLLLEVWDKDPLSQERMGQLAFTTEKLKDLGMAPYEKHWYRLRGVKSGELQVAFKYTPPEVKKAAADEYTNNTGNPVIRKPGAKNSVASSDSLSSNGSLPFSVTQSTSSPSTPEKPPKEERSSVTWGGLVQSIKRKEERRTKKNEDGAVVSPSASPRVEKKHTYQLKDWPSKSGRLKSAVVETVRSLRRDKPSAGASWNEVNADADRGAEMKSDTETRKPKSARLLRKKFSFMKDRRPRSRSESNLPEISSSHDDMNQKHNPKELIRRSTENLAGSTSLSRQRSSENNSSSQPNSPTTAVVARSYSTRLVRRNNSRSTGSCSSTSRGSSPTYSAQEKCPTCDFDVLILTECPSSTVPAENNTIISTQERLIN